MFVKEFDVYVPHIYPKAMGFELPVLFLLLQDPTVFSL
jgi:hypothetical protein